MEVITLDAVLLYVISSARLQNRASPWLDELNTELNDPNVRKRP